MSLTPNQQILREVRSRVDQLRAEYNTARALRKQEKVALAQAEEAVIDATEAQRITQLVAQTVQQQVHTRIAAIVTRCLAAVFDEPYQFRIVFEQKRGTTEARLVFLKDGLELDPMTASGGGVVDVAAFALRLSALLLRRPQLARVMILDEPFRFVSEGYSERVRAMMEQLAEELDFQFIFVTHKKELETGKIIAL